MWLQFAILCTEQLVSCIIHVAGCVADWYVHGAGELLKQSVKVLWYCPGLAKLSERSSCAFIAFKDFKSPYLSFTSKGTYWITPCKRMQPNQCLAYLSPGSLNCSFDVDKSRPRSGKSNQIAVKKSFRKQWPNGLYGIARTLNSASQPVKKRRGLFSSVDSPSQGKRFLVQLVLFFNKCRQWWPGCSR